MIKTVFAGRRVAWRYASILCITLGTGPMAVGAPPVIPGAAGFGIETPAGRGGEIFRVTNLDDAGDGSLRACVEAAGPRLCIFEISGSIRLEDNLVAEHPGLTIAGQTAPAPGILLRDATLQIAASDVLVQHIAVRVGDFPDGPVPDARDALKIGGKNPVENIVIDHVSLSWGIDEVVEVWGDWKNITISNTIISEPLHNSLHSKGPHGLTALIGSSRTGARASFIGNLLAHGHGRNPRSSAWEFAFVNNVIYNAKDAEAMLFNDKIPTKNSIVGNVFIKGRDSLDYIKPIQLVGASDFEIGTQLVKGTLVHLEDNDASCATEDPWSVVANDSDLAREVVEAATAPAWPDGLEAMATANDAVLNHVLGNAGSRPAERDSVDARIVEDVRNGTGRIINCVAGNGSGRCERNAGGWPELPSSQRQHELPADPNGDDDGDGYTNVEEWLHALAAKVEGRAAEPVNDPAPPDDPAPPRPPALQ